MEPGGANPPEEEHNQNENDPHPEKVKSKLGIHIFKPLNFLYGYIENSFFEYSFLANLENSISSIARRSLETIR